jgi:Bacterial lectin
MKVGFSRSVVAAAFAALIVMAGSATAWAQCPASPNFGTDFTTNQACLTLNGIGPQFLSTGDSGPVVLRLTPNTGNQVASAWFNTAQPLQNGFSTSFQFQFTNPSGTPADGIAFVIQNASTGLHAIGFTGGNGGALGYGDQDASTNPSTGEGIPNSLAIEFDTFQNTWDPSSGGSISHVAVQSCATGPNTSHHGQLCSPNGSNSTLGAATVVPDLVAQGAVHSVTITYALACSTCSPATTSNNIHVILDNVDIYPSGVPVNLSSLGLGAGNTAFVGFTGATGGSFEDQDILNWIFTPQAASGVVTVGAATPTTVPFQGGIANKAYDYNALLEPGDVTSATININRILIDQKSCNKLVQKSFPFTTQCFVYQNAGVVNNKSVDSSVLFELTCPGSSTGGTCGDELSDITFNADLGTNFTFLKPENIGFALLAATIGPYPGWLKGVGPDPLHPCTAFTNNSPALFQSNQITSFSVIGDPSGKTVGRSGGGGSCWVATYATSGEQPPGIKVTAPTFTTYTQSTTPQTASYTCRNPATSNLPTDGNPTGPYLTVNDCTQSQSPKPNSANSCTGSGLTTGNLSCTGTFDISTTGLHSFQVLSHDTGGNVNVNIVIYNVKKPPTQ